jgi:hypothetical protein
MNDAVASLGHITENSCDLNFVVDRFECAVLCIIPEKNNRHVQAESKFVHIV